MTSTPPRLDDSPAVSRGPDARADRRWGLVALVTGLLGFYGAATLVYERLQLFLDAGHRTSCDINSWLSCGTVMRTPQAEAFGFPNPFIGIVAYAVVVAVALAVLAGARFAAWYRHRALISKVVCHHSHSTKTQPRVTPICSPHQYQAANRAPASTASATATTTA